MIPIFVYGILRGHTKCKHGKVRGYKLFDMGSFPGAVPASDKDCVVGELIEINATQLNVFDQIEGHPHLYVRTDVEVEVENGTEQAQMYVLAEALRAAEARLQPLRSRVSSDKKENGDTEHIYR